MISPVRVFDRPIPRRRLLVFAVVGAALLWSARPAIPQAPAPSDNPEEFLRQPPRPESIHGHFRLVAIGDLLYSHPLAGSPDPELQKVFQLLRSGDVTIGNREGVIFDLKTFEGHAYGDGNVWGEAAVGKDMRAMGVTMVSVANNHSTDWGGEGLLECQRILDEAGIVHAGGGRDLQDARGAGILQTPKGRVALVSTASTFKPNAGADDRFEEVPSRPGISILRTRVIHLVTAEQLAMIRQLATGLASPLQPAPAPDATEVAFGKQIYRLSDKPVLHYDMDLYDHAGLLKAVREAKQKADLVVFTIHAHESPTGVDDDTPAPPDFLITLFHDAVDAGADEIIAGGPHSLRGVEIYKGRPILYGMGLFLLRPDIKAMQETVFRKFPDIGVDADPGHSSSPAIWYDGVVAVTDFDSGRATSVRLYPIDLANSTEAGRRGVPHLAEPEKARTILATLQKESDQFGTKISIENSVGVIRIP